ncbi:MAG: phosphotransferase [Acidimicrobiales bacterium]
MLTAWGIESVESVEVPALGTMNETWLVRSSEQAVVLRRHRCVEKAAVAFEHEIIDYATTRAIPCPTVIVSLDEGRIVERSGRLYSLYSWERGSHVARGHAGPARSYVAGAMLARIHRALLPFSDGLGHGDEPEGLADLYHRMSQLEHAVQASSAPNLDWVLRNLHARRTWLAANPTAPATCPGEPQLIHGDYQLTNLLFDGNAISAVVDWDRARAASPLMEVVRALDHGL